MCWRVLPLVVVVVLGWAASASAQRLPVQWVDRPLTLPRATLAPDFELRLRNVDGDSFLFFFAGFGVGVTSDFEIGTTLLPLEIAPDNDYLNPDVYIRYRLLRAALELGLEARLELPVHDHTRLELGIPLLWHIARSLRLDTGAFVLLDFGDDVDTSARLPFILSIQTSQRVFLALESGLLVPFGVPLGLFLGTTLGRTVADIRGGFRFPDVADRTDVWELWLALTFYLYL